MKKLLSLILALLLVFSLASCSISPEDIKGLIDDLSSSLNGDTTGEKQPPEQTPGIPVTPEDPENPSNPTDPENPNVPESKYKYTDFTSDEKKIFTDNVGEVIPFIPNDEYYVEGYYEETDYENGICVITVGNTKADFDAYRASLTAYTLDDELVDEYGDTCYVYKKSNLELELWHYLYEGDYYVEIYVKRISGSTTDPTPDPDPNPNPTPDPNGVKNVDFTKATNVKDVTDQGYYIDGCPTTGSPAVLVIPVDFSDSAASSLGYSTDVIEEAFKKNGNVDYYSVYDYYFISSYGKLTLDITVLDEWFRPSKSSSYYENLTDDEGYSIGDQAILDEALQYLEPLMDLSRFDSDGNDIIDAVVLINSLDIGEDDFHWAYRYWNYYTDDSGYYYEYDGVSANDYMWASYQFIIESYDEAGNAIYTDTTVRNTYTYIHEFGHILGAEDYYDTSYTEHPMDGYDMMDAATADHNAFTKFNYGWLTSSRLVTASTSITLTLEDFSKNGDTIIIANSFDEKLGVYQEYYIVVYYTNNGLNSGDYGLFSRDGIVVYHVNAALKAETYDGDTFYDFANTNTNIADQNGYGTENNLIEFVKSADGNYTYAAGDKLPSVTDDQGKRLAYTFTVDSITSSTATITFTKQ